MIASTKMPTCKLAFSAVSFARTRLAKPPHSCNSAYLRRNGLNGEEEANVSFDDLECNFDFEELEKPGTFHLPPHHHSSQLKSPCTWISNLYPQINI